MESKLFCIETCTKLGGRGARLRIAAVSPVSAAKERWRPSRISSRLWLRDAHCDDLCPQTPWRPDKYSSIPEIVDFPSSSDRCTCDVRCKLSASNASLVS